jgi:glycosyltransferase involved in cell wall biosynthesis/cellulose synthase/poly-beta-1,6-N-acetylglucosamine synthase-like glycosyltransferase/O-antigen/teichoic acid export membrane protein
MYSSYHKGINVIVPFHNEEKSLEELIERLVRSLEREKLAYKLIFVNDHSTDNSVDVLKSAVKRFFPKETFAKSRRRTRYGNVRFQTSRHASIVWKLGPRGKSTAILLGGEFCEYDHTAIIDADLSYPPEAIPLMYKQAEEKKLICSRRAITKATLLKKLKIAFQKFIVDKAIFNSGQESQSSLKVFKTEMFQYLKVSHAGRWSIDLVIIKTALDLGWEIDSFDITYKERKHKRPSVSLAKKTAEISWKALQLKLVGPGIYQIRPNKENMLGATIIHKGSKYITHTHLPIDKSAIKVLEKRQALFVSAILLSIAAGLALDPKTTAIVLMAILTTVYFTDILFTLFTLLKSLHFPPEIHVSEEKIRSLDDKALPIYTIMAPLYKESAVLPHFVESIGQIDWPKDKLDVILLLEENDEETIAKAREMNLPPFFRVLIVPHSLPKTKPKACNYGLNFAKGEYIVVYDAEDKPDPLQLKKAYIAFKELGYKYACLQSKLNYYNTNQNLLTRLFTAEYSLWFDLVLPGLQSIDTTIPLGGTSNHFRTDHLRKINGWDPFNVTEDCDLGVRLFKLGKKTAIIDSVTLEEANSRVKNWIRQRSRWLKGYIQTYFVHMRDPIRFIKEHRLHALIFQLVIGLRISFILINPLLWIMTISYFTAYSLVGPQIESIFPPAVYYMAVFSLVFGNFMYLYNYMIGAAKRGTWSVVKYVFLMPFYWFMTSVAALVAFYQLIVKPHYWEKTTHGLNLAKKQEVSAKKIINFNLKQIGIGSTIAKKIVQSNFISGGFLIVASVASHILNFIYNLYLGRKLDIESFGLVSLAGSLVYAISVPISALTGAITHRSAYILGKDGVLAQGFWKTQRSKTLKISLVLAFIWGVLTIPFAQIFRSETILPFAIFIPVWIFGLTGAIDSGFLVGSLMFAIGGLASLLEAATKLGTSIAFVELRLAELVYLSIPLSMLVSYIINYQFAKSIDGGKQEELIGEKYNFPKRFFVSSILNKASTLAFLSLDIIIAKILLSPQDAGRYAMLSLAGKIIYSVGTLFTQFIIPLASKEYGEGKNTNKTFYKLLSIIILTSTAGFLMLGVYGELFAPVVFGPKILSVLVYLPSYTLAIAIQTIAASIILYNQSRNRHLASYLGFISALLLTIVMYKNGNTINGIVNSILLIGIGLLTAVVLTHFFYDKVSILLSNIRDFLGLFKKYPSDSSDKDNLRILILNWRDTKHKWAGGAEVYVHELAKRWVKMGHSVTLFCGNDGHHPRNETIDGVKIIRRGGLYTTYIWAFLYYVLKFNRSFDVIIDSENGIPFFSPLYANVPVIGLVHHVHSEIILKELKLPFVKMPMALIAKVLESKIMPYVYRNCQMVAVSNSTRSDMENLGFGKQRPITVINPGVDLNKMRPYKKTKEPSILYLGRLQPYKSIDTLIKSFARLVKSFPNLKLKIAGFGESRPKLERLVEKLNLTEKVIFLGKVKESIKPRLMGSAWVFVYPSTMEGWGISVIEANACGTVVVASDVPGLRDSVQNQSSGYLIPKKDIEAFAQKIETLITDSNLRKKMERKAIKWASNFDWSTSAVSYIQLIRSVVNTKAVALAYDKN